MKSSRTWSARAVRAAGLALAVAAIAARARDWPVFAPADGRFTVELPGQPMVERSSHWTPVGSVEMTKYWLRVADALLAVEMHDIPPVASALISDDRILDEARDGVLHDMNGTQLEGKSFTYHGAPAREFRYRLPGAARLEERVLAVLVNRRLYIVAGMSREPASDPDVARFFASFRCWGEEEPLSAQGHISPKKE